ncbi:Hypothetical predicted protein [Paramuricea clavata]|uniref:Uncharacterized protein n=1 Tax=Paramuricea clavata TaxID=317549 RepID=A0A6S7J832_PARCT|nr:Hypothetical predicted protein [Paramuricea clavata]
MDGYIFTDVQCLNSYNILAPNLWRRYFRMFELDEIMRQRESKEFAEILNRLREGKHASSDIQKLKERCVEELNCPREAPRLFIQNALVDSYNEKVCESFSGDKYVIKAQDSVIGACSAELKRKIMMQIPYVPLRNSKQLAHKLKLAVGLRTEIATNVRTDDGLTNGASNVVKLIQLTDDNKPSGLVWVQFDCKDVGKKARHENRNLYIRGIQATWTPIKPVTTQFTVGRSKSAQVVRKQFPLRPASAKTVHRSQGDTQSQIVSCSRNGTAKNGTLFQNDSSHYSDGIEFTIIKTERHPDLTVIALYRSPQIATSRLISALHNRTVIDHLYTNIIEEEIHAVVSDVVSKDPPDVFHKDPPEVVCKEPPDICKDPPHVACKEPPDLCKDPPYVCNEPPDVCNEPPHVACKEPPDVCKDPPYVCNEPPDVYN